MNTRLDELIAKAYTSAGAQDDVNKVYLALLQEVLFVPVEKAVLGSARDPEEPFKPLFAKVNDNFYMLAFDRLERLEVWAGEQMDSMDYVEIQGRDVIAGLGEQAFLGLNVGCEFYKEFTADEVKRLKTVVARIVQLRQG
jgi:hypothetical protein